MSKITFEPNASGTGVFTIASPNSSTDYTMNLPEINGGTLVSTDASGNVGIGTTSPGAPLEVSGAIRCSTGFQLIDSGSIGRGILVMDGDNPSFQTGTTAGARSLLFKTEGTERMRIDASGNLLVGKTSNDSGYAHQLKSGAADVTFNAYRPATGTTSSIAIFSSDQGGTFNPVCVIRLDGDLENINNSYGALSDERFKSNIVDASSQLDDIMAVQVRSYTLDSTGDTHIGVVAQELEASGMSGLVKTNDEGMKSVKYSVLYMKAIKALQEAVATIEELKARVAALEAN